MSFIVLPVLTLLALTEPPIYAYPDTSADRLTIQAMVTLPNLTPREETAFRAGLESVMEGTEEYSKTQLKHWTRQLGIEPKIEMMPGFARIGVSFPKNQFSTAASMIESLLRRPEIKREFLESWKFNAERINADPWSLALWPDRAAIQGLRFDDPPAAFRRYVTWGSVSIAIGGAITQSDAASLSRRFADWKPTRLPPIPTDYSKIIPLLKSPHPVNSVEISLPEFAPKSESANVALMTSFALGVGKGSSLFKVLRDELGYSYRQELVLWPGESSIKPRILILRQDGDFKAESVGAIRDALIKAVSSWSTADLERAKGMVRSSWSNLSGPNPLYLSPFGPLTNSLEDQTFMKLFWRTRTEMEWDPELIARNLDAVTLDQAKSLAISWLESSSIRVILGTRL